MIGFSVGGLVTRAFVLHTTSACKALVVLNCIFNSNPDNVQGVIARTNHVAEHRPDANAEAALSRWFNCE